MGYGKGEKILRCKLAAVFRLIDLYGWTQGANTLITARLNQEDEQFLVNPYGMLFHEITASSLLKVGMQVRYLLINRTLKNFNKFVLGKRARTGHHQLFCKRDCFFVARGGSRRTSRPALYYTRAHPIRGGGFSAQARFIAP